MIVGIGTDLLERDRIKDLYNRYKEKFVCKILSKSELDQFAYIQDNDGAGHGTGFSTTSPTYMNSIENTDLQVKVVSLYLLGY